jgi:hypothetical protein
VFDSKQTLKKHFSDLWECSAAHGSGGKKLKSSWQQHYI